MVRATPAAAVAKATRAAPGSASSAHGEMISPIAAITIRNGTA